MNLKNELLGLIAGSGRFPLIFAQEAKKKSNSKLIAIAIKGDASGSISKFVDKIFWINPGELRRIFEILKDEGIKKLAMAGQVNPKNLFNKRNQFDDELRKLLENVKNKKADTIFSAIVKSIENLGVELIDSTFYLKDYLPEAGLFTKRNPTESEWEDIRFGKDIAKAIAYFDIGQTVVIKEKAILAIEAMEGTNETIRRGARIAGRRAVVVKVSKPKQDMRFDIPVVGLNTIKVMIKVRAQCLAIEANKTLFIDKEESIKLANKKGISILAI